MKTLLLDIADELLLFDVDGNGVYYVSPTGRIFSRKRKKFKELKQWYTGDGYLRTKLYNKSITVHRVVAQALVPNPEQLDTVDHINEDKLNNHFTNLRWLSRADNAARAGRSTLTFLSPDGIEITFTGLSEFCRENGLTQANMSKVLLGQRPHHKNWKFIR
jgi:hypothetical protein